MAIGTPKGKFELTAQNKTQRAFNQVRGDLGRIQSGVRGILGPVALLGAATGFVAFGRNTLKSADAIGKFADRIGVSTKALQEYRFAFELAGVAQEETDKGLLTFSKRIGEARAGTGAMVDTLKRINPELLKLIINSQSESEALDIIFMGMGKATSAAEKNAIANAALGRAGVKMTAAFKDGADAFFAATREADRLGLVIDEKLIRNAEKLNDDFTRASGIIGTQLKTAFLELAPAINDAVLEVIGFVTELNNVNRLTDSLLNDQSLGAGFGRIQERIQELQAALKANEESLFSGMFTQLNKDIRDELKSLEIIKKAIIQTVKTQGGLGKNPDARGGPPSIKSGSGGKVIAPLSELQLKQQFGFTKQSEKDLLAIEKRRLKVREEIQNTGFPTDVRERLGDIDSQFVGSLAERAKAKFLIERGIINAGQQFGNNSNETSKQIEERKRMNRALEDEARVLELLKDPLDEAARLENILDDRFRAGKIGALDHADAVKRLREEFGLIPNTVDPVIAALDSIKSGLEVNVTDALFDAIKGVNSFGEASKQMVDLVIKEFIRLQAVQPVLNGLFGQSGSGGGLVGQLLPLALSLFGGPAGAAGIFAAKQATAVPGIFGPGFARGGSFEVGGSGGTDRTPVSFMATRGERVTVQTPAQQRGGGGNTIIIDVRGTNGNREIEEAVSRGLKVAGPEFVSASIRTIRNGLGEDPRFLGN